MTVPPPLAHLTERIGYSFKHMRWLKQALTHRSFGVPNNERLEFIGDAILNYTVGRMLFDRFADQPEGALSRLRANLVNQEVLAEIARELDLGAVLCLGEGEMRSGGGERPSILADALEALFAAVSLDSNFAEAEAVVRRLYETRILAIDPAGPAKDPKTRLQEILQSRRIALPNYQILVQSGEAHAQHFRVICEVPALKLSCEGEGPSRRRAEQQAAEAMLTQLETLSSRKSKKGHAV